MERYSDEAIRVIDELHTERLGYHSEYLPLIYAAQMLADYENKVYDIASGYITEKTVISIPFMLSKSVNYLYLHAINKRDAATTIEPASIGKTVFLTREAAESALAKEAHT